MAPAALGRRDLGTKKPDHRPILAGIVRPQHGLAHHTHQAAVILPDTPAATDDDDADAVAAQPSLSTETDTRVHIAQQHVVAAGRRASELNDGRPGLKSVRFPFCLCLGISCL